MCKFILMFLKVIQGGDVLLHQLPRLGWTYARHAGQKVDGDIGVISPNLQGSDRHQTNMN